MFSVCYYVLLYSQIQVFFEPNEPFETIKKGCLETKKISEVKKSQHIFHLFTGAIDFPTNPLFIVAGRFFLPV